MHLSLCMRYALHFLPPHAHIPNVCWWGCFAGDLPILGSLFVLLPLCIYSKRICILYECGQCCKSMAGRDSADRCHMYDTLTACTVRANAVACYIHPMLMHKVYASRRAALHHTMSRVPYVCLPHAACNALFVSNLPYHAAGAQTGTGTSNASASKGWTASRSLAIGYYNLTIEYHNGASGGTLVMRAGFNSATSSSNVRPCHLPHPLLLQPAVWLVMLPSKLDIVARLSDIVACNFWPTCK